MKRIFSAAMLFLLAFGIFATTNVNDNQVSFREGGDMMTPKQDLVFREGGDLMSSKKQFAYQDGSDFMSQQITRA